MIAILCLILKRLRGLATFSPFHILMTANLLISIEKTNGWIQKQSTACGLLKRNGAYGNALFKGTAAV